MSGKYGRPGALTPRTPPASRRRWGAFPTPLVGIGVSPILGAWLGVGLLAGVAGREGGKGGSLNRR